MSYVKTKREPLRQILNKYELTGQALAKVLQCSKRTATRKHSEPERFTVEDLKRINVYGHIPIEEIRAALK